MKRLCVGSDQPEPRVRCANKRIDKFESNLPADPVPMLRRIVVGMIGGVIFLLAYVLLSVALRTLIHGSDENHAAERRPPVFSYVALGYGVVSLAALPLLPAIVTASGRQRLAVRMAALQDTSNGKAAEAGRRALAALYFIRTVCCCVSLTGAAFLLAVSHIWEGEIMTILFVALLIVPLALHFPSRDRFERWMDHEQRLLEQLRTGGGSAL